MLLVLFSTKILQILTGTPLRTRLVFKYNLIRKCHVPYGQQTGILTLLVSTEVKRAGSKSNISLGAFNSYHITSYPLLALIKSYHNTSYPLLVLIKSYHNTSYPLLAVNLSDM